MARKPADQSVNRQDILLAAADVLYAGGYEATTMKDIAAAVNLTAASLYHHFPNGKDELLLDVLEVGLERAISQVEPVCQSVASPVERLRGMVHGHIVCLTEHTAVGAAMVFEIRSLLHMGYASSAQFKPGYEALIARRDAFFARRKYYEGLFQQVVRDGMQQGVFRSVDVPLVTKVMLGAQNWMGVWYEADGRLSGAAIADVMVDMFLHGLSQPAGE